MKISKVKFIIITVYLAMIMSLLILKAAYLSNDTERYGFMLKPVVFLITAVTGTALVNGADGGYISGDGRIIINKSCSGYNYLLFLMIISIYIILMCGTDKYLLLTAILNIPALYLYAVIVNFLRIYSALIIDSFRLIFKMPYGSFIHFIWGIIVFILATIVYTMTLSVLLRKILKGASNNCFRV